MSAQASVVVIGAGGHAKVVVATLVALGREIAAIVDDDPARHGSSLLGLAVTGPVASFPLSGRPAIVAIGDNAARHRVSGALDCRWQAVVHPSAIVHPSVRIGEGAFVAAGAVIQPDSEIGPHSIVNTGATVDHDCRVGGWAHLAPGVHLAGDVKVGAGALVGLGAGIAPGVSIGDWTVLGAGAMAVSDIADRVMAVGVPARSRGDE